LKITRHSIISVLLIFIAILLAHTTETGFSIGDKIFTGLGISSLTDGQTGFHYPIIIYFVLFIIGCMEARRVMSRRQLIAVLLLLFITVPSAVSLAKPVYYKMHNGLDTVEYDSTNTQFNIRCSEDGKYIEIIGAITLTNYGNDLLYLGIKIPSEGDIKQKWFSNDLILTGVDSSSEFILPPGQKRTILTYTKTPLINDYNGQGSMSGPKLILFTDNKTRTVGYNL